MYIHELAQHTGVPATTIRYYESIELLPRPPRGTNNYRQYTPVDAERLRLLTSARSLGFTLDEIGDILTTRDAGVAPCGRVLATLDQHLLDVEQRIADLLQLRTTLTRLRRDGERLPHDAARGEPCVCGLLTQYAAHAPRDPREVPHG